MTVSQEKSDENSAFYITDDDDISTGNIREIGGMSEQNIKRHETLVRSLESKYQHYEKI